MTKNTDLDKYFLSGFGNRFDLRGSFELYSSNRFGKYRILSGVDRTFAVHAGNKKKDILAFNKYPTDKLGDNTIL